MIATSYGIDPRSKIDELQLQLGSLISDKSNLIDLSNQRQQTIERLAKDNKKLRVSLGAFEKAERKRSQYKLGSL